MTKHLSHKLHSQPHLPVETTSYGEAWRAFQKQNFGLWLTTCYSTVSITCTQTRIHRTQSLHYDKLLKRSTLRLIVTTNFAATIYGGDISFCFARYLCNEVSLERYLGEIWCRLYRYLGDLLFYRSAIHVMFRWYIGDKSQEQSMIFVDYRLHYFCTVL